MAGGKLTKQQISDLAEAFSTRALETVLLLSEETGLDDDDIKDIRFQNPGDAKAQSREMLTKWGRKNSANPVKTLAELLYKTAKSSGNVDPHKVQKILGLTEDQAFAQDGVGGTSGGIGAAAASAPSGGKLTERKIRQLSTNITGPGQLRDLGTLGLGVSVNIINKHLNNERDITEAAIKVITDWKSDTEEAVAYEKMCEALVEAGLRSLITQVLEKDK